MGVAELVPLANLPENAVKKPKANLMLECICWDPAARKQFTCSIGSMPMRLRAANGDSEAPDRMAGNKVSCTHNLKLYIDFG